jgi:hypothetical protein
MDAHFNEYLAAIAGMAEVYGGRTDDAHASPDVPQDSGTPEPVAAAV